MRGSSFNVASSRLKLRIESSGWSAIQTPCIKSLALRASPYITIYRSSFFFSLPERLVPSFFEVSDYPIYNTHPHIHTTIYKLIRNLDDIDIFFFFSRSEGERLGDFL